MELIILIYELNHKGKENYMYIWNALYAVSFKYFDHSGEWFSSVNKIVTFLVAFREKKR